MKIDVNCTWGDGPDVAMNLHPSKEEQEGMKIFSDDLIPVDFTVEEARKLANKLLISAMQAELLEQAASSYYSEIKKLEE